jgi:hypothetical protein
LGKVGAPTEPAWWPDPEVTGRSIRTADSGAWTDAQRAALTEYLEAVVGEAIREGDHHRLDG